VTASTNLGDGKFLADMFKGRVPGVAAVSGGVREIYALAGARKWKYLYKGLNPSVGDHADKYSDYERNSAKEHGDTPLGYVKGSGGQSTSANSDNDDLNTDGDNINGNEERITVDTFKNVEFIVQTAITTDLRVK
jgi:hypothetical protein